MTADNLIAIAAAMRMAQREYYATKNNAALRHAKDLEGRFDKAMLEWQEIKSHV